MLKPSLLFVGATLFATVLSVPETKALTKDDDGGGDEFVVVMTGDDSSVQALFDRYPEMSGS